MPSSSLMYLISNYFLRRVVRSLMEKKLSGNATLVVLIEVGAGDLSTVLPVELESSVMF